LPAAGRSDLREQLVLNNLEIASAIAGRMAGRSSLREDLEQVACVALVTAAHKFDPHRGHAFLSYAVPCMTGAIKRYMRDTAWTVRPPRSVQEMHLRGRDEDNHTTDRVDVESCWRPFSLDALVAGTSVSLGVTIPDTRAPLPCLRPTTVCCWSKSCVS
jgi:RNA polymerase sigma-B factor